MQDQKSLKLLQRICKPFILRRMKKDVLKELPERIDQIIYCEMDSKQAHFYEALRQGVAQESASLDFKNNRIQIFSLLTRLRQAALHPALLDNKFNAYHSAKLDEFSEFVEKTIANGHRMLVFSQFTSLLSLVKPILHNKKIAYSYLDGSTQSREEVIFEFKKSLHPVFLLSLKVGGVGLNLTEADVVVHLDPWWNPAVENQATDRAHRMGQNKTVFNYKFITKNTIEEKIIELQKHKSKLFSGLLDDASFDGKLSVKDIEFLLER